MTQPNTSMWRRRLDTVEVVTFNGTNGSAVADWAASKNVPTERGWVQWDGTSLTGWIADMNGPRGLTPGDRIVYGPPGRLDVWTEAEFNSLFEQPFGLSLRLLI